ncbi:hypothetical protein HN937_12290 [Candidatus Poribacteria bacterium]|jgi:hypothetical protein|nr:hypothetical protein [Candidatus Poribacteria bacterium]
MPKPEPKPKPKPNKFETRLLAVLDEIAETLLAVAEGYGATIERCTGCGRWIVVTRNDRRLCWRCRRGAEEQEEP